MLPIYTVTDKQMLVLTLKERVWIVNNFLSSLMRSLTECGNGSTSLICVPYEKDVGLKFITRQKEGVSL